MKTHFMTVIVAACCICSGCASGLLGVLPEVPDRSNASEIYVVRPYNFVASANSAYVSFDNVELFALRTRQYTKFLAPPGNHTIGVRYPGFPANTIAIALTPKQNYYYAVSVGFSNFSLIPKKEEEAMPSIESSKFVPLDNTTRN